MGWAECNWDARSGGGCPYPYPPESFVTKWKQLDRIQRYAASELGFDEDTWNAPVASRGWQYNWPLEQYFGNYFSWSDMLDHERNLFICLEWDESSWMSRNTKVPSLWKKSWNDLTTEQQTCAGGIGYFEAKWKNRQENPYKYCDDSGVTYGGDIRYGREGEKMTAPVCQQLCREVDGCKYFTSYQDEDGDCALSTGNSWKECYACGAVSGDVYCDSSKWDKVPEKSDYSCDDGAKWTAFSPAGCGSPTVDKRKSSYVRKAPRPTLNRVPRVDSHSLAAEA